MQKVNNSLIFFFHVLLLLFSNRLAEIPAFPGAQGFGATSSGGRGGTVIRVTNLNDSGPGSLRSAIAASGKRIVVFAVCGTIELLSGLVINNSHITIAGQTAPGGGICLKNSRQNGNTPIVIRTHDVIIRYLRIRPGPGGEPDGITLRSGSAKVIIDHCSVSWAVDENISSYSPNKAKSAPHDFTIQWCIIASALEASTHSKGKHGCGMLLGADNAKNISIHHNLFAHNWRRNPLIKADGLVECINNVIYNYVEFAMHSRDVYAPQIINYISNYIKPGPTTDWYNTHIEKTYGLVLSHEGKSNKGFKVYLAGNYGPNPNNRKQLSRVQSHLVHRRHKDFKPNYIIKKSHLVSHEGISVFSAKNSYDKVLATAGAVLPLRDRVDKGIINDVITHGGEVINCVESKPIKHLTGTVQFDSGFKNKKGGPDKRIILSRFGDNNNNALLGYLIEITQGTGAGQVRQIIDSDPGYLVFVQIPWITIPDTTSHYRVICDCAKNAGGWPDLMTGFLDKNTNNIPDTQEKRDLNQNGMDDRWEQRYRVSNPLADPDNDGYSNIEEFINRTNPFGLVRIPRDSSQGISSLLFSQFEISEAEYGDVMRQIPLCFKYDEKPVANITFYDALLYCNRRSKREGLSPVYQYANALFDDSGRCISLTELSCNWRGNGYRLPTAQEWRYAYLAGTRPDENNGYFWQDSIPDQYAWYARNAEGTTQSIGGKQANAWGLYDMAGNVQEWIWSAGPNKKAYAYGGTYKNGLKNTDIHVHTRSYILKTRHQSITGFRVVRIE